MKKLSGQRKGKERRERGGREGGREEQGAIWEEDRGWVGGGLYVDHLGC